MLLIPLRVLTYHVEDEAARLLLHLIKRNEKQKKKKEKKGKHN